MFSINARGDLLVTGVLRLANDSVAGSVVTDENGEATVQFEQALGTGKPVVELTVEGETTAFAQIVSFTKDDAGRYTGLSNTRRNQRSTQTQQAVLLDLFELAPAPTRTR